MPKNLLTWGYTTGTCAQAATKAAVKMLLCRKKTEQIQVELPGGKELTLDIHDIQIQYAGTNSGVMTESAADIQGNDIVPVSVSCAVQKDSGDDPDVTDGIWVYSKVERTNTGGITLEGGKGVGRVTKPGLEQPVGSAAINKVPRRMILKEVEEACEEAGYRGGIRVEISVPEGERLAAKTFNPRLGIEGGLSILGTSGMVEPMSEQALVDTIRLEMQVKLAENKDYLIITPGNYGLDFLKNTYGIETEDVVKCSNYIGQTLDMAAELGCKAILIAGHIGKLIKVAGGIMNTHSKWADCRMELLAAAALRSKIPVEKVCELLDCVTMDDALGRCSKAEREQVMNQVMDRIEASLSKRTGEKMQTGAIVFSNVYGILGKTEDAERLLTEYREHRGM